MRVFLGHFRQQPRDKLIYAVDYSDWLKESEELSAVVLEVGNATVPPLAVSNSYLVGTDKVEFFIEGGLSGSEYQVTVRATTTLGQTIEKEFTVAVEEL